MKKITIFVLCGLLLVACTKEPVVDPIKPDPPVTTTYVIEVVADPNINATNVGINKMSQNVALPVAATPKDGYVFDVVKLNGVIVPTTEDTKTISYTFTNVNTKIEFTARRPFNWDLAQVSWVTCYMKNRLLSENKWYTWYPPQISIEKYVFNLNYDLRIYDTNGVLTGGNKYTMPSKDSLMYGQTRFGILLTKDTLKMNHTMKAYFVGGLRDPAHDVEQTEIYIPQK